MYALFDFSLLLGQNVYQIFGVLSLSSVQWIGLEVRAVSLVSHCIRSEATTGYPWREVVTRKRERGVKKSRSQTCKSGGNDLHGRALLPPEDRGGWRLVQVELLPLAALCSPSPAPRSRCPGGGGGEPNKSSMLGIS